MKIKSIAVDDEPVALQVISGYIRQTEFLELKATYSNAIEALRAIQSDETIQLVFLDIRMPDLSGMELAKIIEQTGRSTKIRVVFTSAYDQYALEGYKVAALDYLLKPFNFVDFSRSAEKARTYFSLLDQRGAAEASPESSAADKKYIYLKVDHQLVKIDTDDILYIEALKDYVKLFFKSGMRPILSLVSLKSIEEKLNGSDFIRIHRSYIIAGNAVTAITKNALNIGGIQIAITDQFKPLFQEYFKDWG